MYRTCTLIALSLGLVLTTVASQAADEEHFGLFAGKQGGSTSDNLERYGILNQQAFAKGMARGVRVEGKIRNEHPAFVVRVDVDHKDRVYEEGELLHVTVVSERSGYLYLFYVQADKKVACLFPNEYQSDNHIDAGEKTVVPAPDARFNLRIRPPLGEETLLAVVSRKRIKPAAFGVKSLTDSMATPLAKGMLPKAVEVELADKPDQWAEHHITIQTVASREAEPQKQRPKRVGLFVGIDDYEDGRISKLHVCAKDARLMCKMMRDKGKLDGAVLITDSKATLANIRKALLAIAEVTRQDDEVFIFWSGHGARCADDNGEEDDAEEGRTREEDGLDEFLVPHDGKVDSPAEVRRTMLIDDTFGRWVQDLDGRKVVVMLDTCHAGGISSSAKGIVSGPWEFNFWQSEYARTKDIGGPGTALLCSSQANQPSKERKDRKASVMTYYLLECLNNGSNVTLDDAYRYLQTPVMDYTRKNWPHHDPQEPMLVNDIGEVYLRP